MDKFWSCCGIDGKSVSQQFLFHVARIAAAPGLVYGLALIHILACRISTKRKKGLLQNIICSLLSDKFLLFHLSTWKGAYYIQEIAYVQPPFYLSHHSCL